MDIILVTIGGYSIGGYWWLLMAIIFVTIMVIQLMAIGG
jgi:hypothetical protein